MHEDSEGFLYPRVDEAACANCGLCEKVCNELHPYAEQAPQQVLAAVNLDEQVRLQSSSGGIFHLLASQTIAEGGVVFGARFDDSWQVVIDYTETTEGIKAFMGSKYVQARTETAFRDAKRFLQSGRKVLFSGTPCQIAALRHFLRKDYDNLLAVDFVCHGTPSPKVWRLYLNEIQRSDRHAKQIEFRNKTNGWKNYSFCVRYDESNLLSPFGDNPYMKAFLQDITLRPSCYACKAKAGRSHSDITLADFWGIETVVPEMDDDKGTGMVFLNTAKGAASLDLAKLRTCPADYETVKALNPACFRAPKENPCRSKFFAKLNGRKSVIALMERFTRPSRKEQLRECIDDTKYFVKRALLKVITPLK